MTLNDIDRLLIDWQKKLELASQNLLDLQNLPTYQRLAGEGGFAKTRLTGITAQEIELALQSMQDLFQQFDLLSQTIERAKFLRREINTFWGTDPRLQNVVDILTGKSVQLSTVTLPLSQRGLLSAADQSYCVTPAVLLTTMQSAFDGVRDRVLAVDQAWLSLEPKLLSTFAEIEVLEQQGANLAAAKVALIALHDRVFSDPLGVKDEFDQTIAPLIAQARSALATAQAQRQQVEQDLERARLQWQRLQDLHHQAGNLHAEVEIQMVLALSPATLKALADWLARLETKFTEGAIAPTQIGLRNWHQQVQQAIDSLQAALSTHTQLLQYRQELRGRLDALQAKALARGMAEDPTLVYFANQAQQLLYRSPTDLKAAADLVGGYERWLNQR